jgi:hypothetical protein
MFELYASLTAPSRGSSEELDAVNAIDQAVLEPLRIAFASLGSCNKLLNDLASPTDFSPADKTRLAERSGKQVIARCRRAVVEASNCRKGMGSLADEAGAQYLSAIRDNAGTMRQSSTSSKACSSTASRARAHTGRSIPPEA